METSDRLEGAQSIEARYTLLVEAITDYAIYMLDPEGRVTSWNPGARRFKGYEAEEIIGEHFSRFYTAQDQADERPQLALAEAAKTGRFEREGWRVRKDGSQFWAHVIIDAIRSPDGELIGFAKITRDLTERRQVEAKLRESEQQFRLLVQGVTDYAIYMLDPEGRVASWNAGAQRIKGYTPEEIIGRHFSDFYTEEDRAAGLPQEGLATAAEQGRWENEGRRVRKDGSPFWAHVVIDAIRDDQGALVGFAKVTRDITERRNAEAALKEAQASMLRSQKLEAIGQLTGGVAHDFNNLLQVISGNLQLLAKDLAGNARAEMRLQNAMAGVARGSKLAAQLLAFARRHPLEPKVLNLGRLVRGMDDMLRRTLGGEVEIETVTAGGLWNTLVDPDQLENAVLNLAINARDAMDAQGRLTIEASNAFLDDEYARQHDVTPGQYVMLAVTDTGGGIPPEILDRVFDPFFSTKPEGKGTGLGLAMVYGFLKQSGGHAKVYSEPESGTTVKLYFPRAMASEDTHVVLAGGDAVGGDETILVVEDDDEVRDVAVSLLSELGYRVLKARDAAAALVVVESGIPIDLVFTDVMMPGPVRSPELARKAKERLPNVAVLFTSGYTQNAIVHGGRLDHGVELLAKPYTRDALARKVRQVLANQAQKQVTTAAPRQSPAGKGLADTTVLLVEDDEIIRSTTADMLKDAGCRVLEAGDAARAFELLKSETVDILLTDIGLPGTSGLDLARQVRAEYPQICIVVASGDNGAAAETGLLGASLVVKPFTAGTLRQTLTQALKGKTAGVPQR